MGYEYVRVKLNFLNDIIKKIHKQMLFSFDNYLDYHYFYIYLIV